MSDSLIEVSEAQNDVVGGADAELKNSLPNAFRLWEKSILQNLDVCIPCIVEDYDRESHLAQVKPLIKRTVLSDGQSFDRASVVVSVWRWQCGGFMVDMPVFKGDTGWLISSDRDCATAKEKNCTIQETKDKKASAYSGGNEGPQTTTAGSVDTHVQGCGIFIPDMWGRVKIPKSEHIGSLFVKQLNKDGTTNGEIVIDDTGTVEINVGFESKTDDPTKEANFSRVLIHNDKIVVVRSNRESGAASATEETITFSSEEGFKYEGTPDCERTVITALRYDINTHQIQAKTATDGLRGDFIVKAGEVGDWTVIDGGQAVPEATE